MRIRWVQRNHALRKPTFPTCRFIAPPHSTAEGKGQESARLLFTFVLSGFARWLSVSSRPSTGGSPTSSATLLTITTKLGSYVFGSPRPPVNASSSNASTSGLRTATPHFCWTDVERELKLGNGLRRMPGPLPRTRRRNAP